jgi:hypothetical protein
MLKPDLQTVCTSSPPYSIIKSNELPTLFAANRCTSNEYGSEPGLPNVKVPVCIESSLSLLPDFVELLLMSPALKLFIFAMSPNKIQRPSLVSQFEVFENTLSTDVGAGVGTGVGVGTGNRM